MSADMNRTKLEMLLDTLAESVENASAEELLGEGKQAGQNTEQAAARVRELLLDAVRRFEQQKLHAARAMHRKRSSELRKHRRDLPPTVEERRGLLFGAIEKNEGLRSVTARFRNLTDLSDEDVQSALEDLMELGGLDEPDAEDEKP